MIVNADKLADVYYLVLEPEAFRSSDVQRFALQAVRSKLQLDYLIVHVRVATPDFEKFQYDLITSIPYACQGCTMHVADCLFTARDVFYVLFGFCNNLDYQNEGRSVSAYEWTLCCAGWFQLVQNLLSLDCKTEAGFAKASKQRGTLA